MWSHEGAAAKIGVRTLARLVLTTTLVVGCGGSVTDTSRGVGTGEASGGETGDGGNGNGNGVEGRVGLVCNPGIGDYMRKQILEAGGLACMTANDCQIVSFGGRCRLDCGTALNVTEAGPLTKAALAYSDANCSGCIITDAACPPVFYTAECQNGQCTRVP